jgi:hypothetical protein
VRVSVLGHQNYADRRFGAWLFSRGGFMFEHKLK